MFYREMEMAGATISPYAPHTYDAVWAMALALSRAEQLWKNPQTDGNKLELRNFDYDRKDMALEFLNQFANLSFLGVSVSIFKNN